MDNEQNLTDKNEVTESEAKDEEKLAETKKILDSKQPDVDLEFKEELNKYREGVETD